MIVWMTIYFRSFQAMAFTSLGVVLISTLTFVLGTFPEFQSYEESGTPEEYPEAVLAMEMIDNVLVGFFVIEYVVSKLLSPLHFPAFPRDFKKIQNVTQKIFPHRPYA